MSRRIASVALLAAWLCASGAMLDMAQVFAWTRMFAGYAGHESISRAAKDTFDPERPCAICMAVSKAREASKPSPAAPAKGAERLVMIFQPLDLMVVGHIEFSWPKSAPESAPARNSEVPVQPPRAGVA